MIPISLDLFNILQDLKKPFFDHVVLAHAFANRRQELSSITFNYYNKYINQFIPLFLSEGIFRTDKHFNKVFPMFYLNVAIDQSRFIINPEPMCENIKDDFNMSELFRIAEEMMINVAEITVKMSQAEQIKLILEKSITYNEYSELRISYQELKEKCFELHGRNNAIETILDRAGLL